MSHRGASWLAARRQLPTSLRAVFGYYADTGVFAPGSLALKRRVDARVEEMVADAFEAIEAELAAEFGYEHAGFEYETKLLLPVNLTLGQVYRQFESAKHGQAEELARLGIEALLDGDMRDARNDEEFEDFEVGFPVTGDGRREVARIAQEVLERRVDERLEAFPPGVRDIYDWAVERSERHQEEDRRFRELVAAAREGDPDAREGIRSEYRDAGFEDPPEVFTERELELPYLATQYDRVGVIYDAMVRIYREVGFDIDAAFHRSIVLAIIGAQVWLDDVEDYEDDIADGQLTPVTAEYLLAEDRRTAHDAVVEVSRAYLDRAKAEATAADSVLTGLATEYIIRDGRPERLPGAGP